MKLFVCHVRSLGFIDCPCYVNLIFICISSLLCFLWWCDEFITSTFSIDKLCTNTKWACNFCTVLNPASKLKIEAFADYSLRWISVISLIYQWDQKWNCFAFSSLLLVLIRAIASAEFRKKCQELVEMNWNHYYMACAISFFQLQIYNDLFQSRTDI